MLGLPFFRLPAQVRTCWVAAQVIDLGLGYSYINPTGVYGRLTKLCFSGYPIHLASFHVRFHLILRYGVMTVKMPEYHYMRYMWATAGSHMQSFEVHG